MLKEDKLAEEWLDEKYLKNMGIRRTCKVAFLAGFKAGREIEKEYVKNNAFTSMKEQGLFPFTKWHKVADGDLPKDARYVWTNVGAGYHDDDGWWDDFGRLQGVIAWCEPKFEE